MKKLIPALCMLLVAACLMGTSTYAWFAANETVTASGMQVKAAADGGLAIATYTGTRGSAESTAAAPTDNDFKATVAAGWANIADTATIKPTSSNNGKWFSASASDASSFVGGKYIDVSSSVTGYYQKTKFQIKSLDQSANAQYTLKVTDVTVSIKDDATATSEALNRSLRVAICVNGTSWHYFAPAYDSSAVLKYTESLGTGTGDPVVYPGVTATYGATDKNTITCGATGLSTPIYTALTTTAITLDVYVYYEGEDQNCNSNNAAKVDNLVVELGFSATKN